MWWGGGGGGGWGWGWGGGGGCLGGGGGGGGVLGRFDPAASRENLRKRVGHNSNIARPAGKHRERREKNYARSLRSFPFMFTVSPWLQGARFDSPSQREVHSRRPFKQRGDNRNDGKSFDTRTNKRHDPFKSSPLPVFHFAILTGVQYPDGVGEWNSTFGGTWLLKAV